MSDRLLVENSENLERVVQAVLARMSNNVRNAPRRRGRNFLDGVGEAVESGYTGDFATFLNKDGKIEVSPGHIWAGYKMKTTEKTVFEPGSFTLYVEAEPDQDKADFSVSITKEKNSSSFNYYELIAYVSGTQISQIWKNGSIRILDRWV